MRVKTTFFFKTCTALFFVLLFCFTKTAQGQTLFSCFNLEKIKKLYVSTFLEINFTLLNENWEIVANTTRTPFVFGIDTLMYDNFSHWKYKLSVDNWAVSLYRKKGIDPIFVYQTSRTCYETIESELLKKRFTSQKIMEDSVLRFSVFHIKQGIDIIFIPHKGRQAYTITVCNYTQVDSLIKVQIEERKEYIKLLQEQHLLIHIALKQADSLRRIEAYDAAVLVLEQVANQHFLEREELIIENQEVKNKMDTVKEEISLKNYKLYMYLANNAFTNKNYPLSKKYLFMAQQIDSTSQIVSQKLNEIEKIESTVIIRKDSIFNYMFYNKPTCDIIQITIFKRIRNYFLNIDAGDISFTYTLHTDTLGQNLSIYQVNRFILSPTAKLSYSIDTEETWALFLDTLIGSYIPSVLINYLYVNATTTFQHQSSWKTSFVKTKYGGKKIKFSPSHIPVTEKNRLLSYFKNNNSLPSGRYTAEKKELLYQDSLYTSLALKKMYAVGPEAMLYSLLFPGAGSIAATQGKKGWGTFSACTIFYSMAGIGHFVANSLEKKEQEKAANYVKWASYISLGIGGVIHFTDIFVALKRGIDNLNKTRALKAKLNENPIYIQEFPQQIEP